MKTLLLLRLRIDLLSLILLLSQLTFVVPTQAQTRLYVTTGGGNSSPSTATSWANATSNLQGAIDALRTSGGEVWVARGTYRPGGNANTNRALSFSLCNSVTVYGGFQGAETALNQRPAVNPFTGQPSSTTLSGDIGQVGNTADNSYHVFYHQLIRAVNNTAVLDGVVITGGNADAPNALSTDGGGMYNERSCSPRLINCLFVRNRASGGGGMENDQSSSPVLTNCVFMSNTANSGGGMYNYDLSSPVLTNCSFLNNTSAGDGGGMINVQNSRPTLTNCSFLNNTATADGGGMNSSGGSNTILVNCLFSNNSAGYGGGIEAYSGNTMTLTNCAFIQNTATIRGGGVYNSNRNRFTMTNCSFLGNSSAAGGAIHNNIAAILSMQNCAFYGNGGSNTIFNDATTLTATYCLFEQGVTGYTGSNNLNTSVSPFVSTSSAALNSCSQAINAGNPATTNATVGNTDLAGNARFLGTIDIGAYEYQSAPSAIVVTNPSIATATVGQSFSQSFGASGGTSPYSFSIASGSLPTGLTLATTGLLSGTSTQAGSFSITVRAIDNTGCSSLGGTYVLTVSEAVFPLTISGFAGSPNPICSGSLATFSATIGNVTGSYAFTLTNGNSPISGTAATSSFSQSLIASGSGTQSFTLTLNSNGQITTATTTLTVNGPLQYYTVKAGSWNDVTVWGCGNVPTAGAEATLNHVVTLPTSYVAQTKILRYGTGGKLSLATGARLIFAP
ncbi:hypothetical protein GCM10027592_32110 [Spirosoma flavus]